MDTLFVYRLSIVALVFDKKIKPWSSRNSGKSKEMAPIRERVWDWRSQNGSWNNMEAASRWRARSEEAVALASPFPLRTGRRKLVSVGSQPRQLLWTPDG